MAFINYVSGTRSRVQTNRFILDAMRNKLADIQREISESAFVADFDAVLEKGRTGKQLQTEIATTEIAAEADARAVTAVEAELRAAAKAKEAAGVEAKEAAAADEARNAAAADGTGQRVVIDLSKWDGKNRPVGKSGQKRGAGPGKSHLQSTYRYQSSSLKFHINMHTFVVRLAC